VLSISDKLNAVLLNFPFKESWK